MLRRWPNRMTRRGRGARMTPEMFISDLKAISTWEILLLADLGLTIDSGNPESGDQVSGWVDQSENIHDASQNTDANQLTLISSGVAGRTALDADGVSDCMDVSVAGGWGSGTSHNLFVVANPATLTALQCMLGFQSGLLLFEHTGPTSGVIELRDSVASRALGNTATGAALLEWHADGVGGTVEGFRNAVSLGSDSYAATSLGGAAAIMSTWNQSGRWTEGLVALILLYTGATPLSAAAISSIRTTIQRYYAGLF